MKSAAERQAEFLADLRALLRKHGATFEVDQRTSGWSNWGYASIGVIAIYDDNNECVADYASFDLPGYLAGEEPTK